MNRIYRLWPLFLLLLADAFGQGTPNTKTASVNPAFFKDVSGFFKAWELVAAQQYGLRALRPVDFIFFDSLYVYSTSPITVPSGPAFRGPRLMGVSYLWRRSQHRGKITLPDHTVVPVGLMSFAGQNPDDSTRSFFVMPLVDFWEKAGVTSQELGMTRLVTGVFVHEFSHSQQMQNFGREMSSLEKASQLEVEFTDDIVQNLYEKDTEYVALYNQENQFFYRAAAAPDATQLEALTLSGLECMDRRHDKYFNDRAASLATIDAFFLTMEGLGQFSMYTWMVHPRGGNLPPALALSGVRRNGKWWSQEEGLGLFLVLNRLAPDRNWASPLFGTQTTSVVELIREQLARRPR
ncbi:MAG TPA: hypothetical protein VG870_06930 [Chitinophagaceae bacterium]|nr:hypothetical protein [Chitinophagaceae bacterium]